MCEIQYYKQGVGRSDSFAWVYFPAISVASLAVVYFYNCYMNLLKVGSK